MNIRPMRWWDIEDVHALEQQLFPHDSWSVEQFWSELARPTRKYVVAIAHEAIVGYAGIFYLPPDADLQTIAVAPQEQGTGVATALLTSLIEQARDCAQMMLEVRADNDPAISLYERFGFEMMSRRTNYYPDNADAIIMRLRPVRT
jgi:[ribosomal protein S18]-alanine N-acetyltransferase